MKIGIFGGSFNPPHKMHLHIAKSLLSRNYVDKVIFVPVSNFYGKKGLVSNHHRYEMLKLLVKNYPNMEVSDYEFQSHLVYTYETLRHFKEQYPQDEIYFICGMDNLEEFSTWHHHEEILSTYQVIVITRNKEIEIPQYLKPYQKNIVLAETHERNISSTNIRNQLLEGKVDENLSREVYQYIKDNKLYEKENL